MVHFSFWEEPKPGDLVIGSCPRLHEWKIGWYVEALPKNVGGAVIREIGSNKLCNYYNEEFFPIRGLNQIDTLEGLQREFYNRVLNAFSRGDEYCYRYGGIRFEGDTAIVLIREVFGGALSQEKGDSIPFEVAIKMRKRMSVDAILKVMREGGYGTRKFEYAQKEQPSQDDANGTPNMPRIPQ